MSNVYKMLKKSLKNDKLASAVLNRFNARRILNLNRDFDWQYEQSKCDYIHHLIKERNNYSRKTILKAYKRNVRSYWFYEEYEIVAKVILKNWRQYE